ncbi:hypothetical protein MHU86_13756 [Fragilaria crotonensis]|nr:hypothetical protein MHU86_13756 [Fragilaria crotonensis]
MATAKGKKAKARKRGTPIVRGVLVANNANTGSPGNNRRVSGHRNGEIESPSVLERLGQSNSQEANDGGGLENARGSPYRDAALTTPSSTPTGGDALPIGGVTNAAVRVLQQQCSLMAGPQIGDRLGNGGRISTFRDVATTTNLMELHRRQVQVRETPLTMTTTGNGGPLRRVVGDQASQNRDFPSATTDGLMEEVDENTPPYIIHAALGRDENDDLMDNTETHLSGKSLSYRKARHCQQTHVTHRIQNLVKKVIFRKLKFVTNDALFWKAMKVVIEAEDPVEQSRFVKIYKTCVLQSLNTKRSTCEQAGAKIARELLIAKNHPIGSREPPYSVETLCKLRRSRTDHEREAFHWFIGEFLECVSGRRVWGRKKFTHKVSDPMERGSAEKVVTVSDEAFAILVYENYIDKWLRKYTCEQQGVQGEDTNEIEKRIKGRYTAGTTTRAANIMYGGWSDEGLIRFNQLCRLVAIDRQNENAAQMEEQVLQRLREQRYGNGGNNDGMEQTDETMLQWEPVEAFCEL